MNQGWEFKKLGDILIIERGGSPRPIQKYLTNSPDGINWIKISDATASNKYIYETKEKITKEGLQKTRIVNEGDFILSNSMSFGRPYIMKTSGCIHDGWLVLKQNEVKVFDVNFLYYLLSSPFVFNQFDYLAAGSTVRNLNISLVSSIKVPLPPLPEQQRIVSILDKVFAAIDKAKANAEQNLKNARDVFNSYLQGVFEKKGDGWEHIRMGDICQIYDGTHFSPKNGRDGDYMYITAKNIKPYYIDVSNISYVTEDDHNDIYSRCSPKKGDVLYIKDGATAGIATVNTIEEEFSMLSSVALIKCSNIILNTFLVHYMNSSVGKKNFLGYLDGAAITRLTLIKIKNVCFSIPTLEEQQSIVNKLDALRAETQKLEAIYKKKLDCLEELKKSVLQKAFAGELIEDV